MPFLLGWVSEYECSELVPHVHGEDVAASLAAGADHVLLHLNHGLGVLTLFTQDKLLDESIQHILKLARLVATIHDVPLVLHVRVGLGAQLAAKVLGDISWGTAEGAGHIDHVDKHGLDPVPLALHLGLKPGHFVPVEGILNVSVDIKSHVVVI
jgi:hypothetical protein